MAFADDEVFAGYCDGLDPDSPEPSDNRTPAYRHGWRNGRDDRAGLPRATASTLRKEAAQAKEMTK